MKEQVRICVHIIGINKVYQIGFFFCCLGKKKRRKRGFSLGKNIFIKN